MPETMWAMRKARREPGLWLEQVPVPRPGADEVLVQVEAASLCGTDLHIYHWDEWAQHRLEPPLTIGHEFSGTVVEIGRRVRNVKVGDFVSAESHVTCGMCFQCRTGHAHMCERTQILGVDRDGALAEFVAVPEAVIWQNDRSRLKPEIAALQEPFGNSVFATSEQDLAGRTIGVLGCGPIGLFTVGIARAAGAAGIWAADRSPYRLGLADVMGATATVDVTEVDDLPAWYREQNEGVGLDVVFEMSGSGRAITDAFRLARNGGRVILFGIPSRPVEIDVAEALIFKNLNVLALNGRKIFETWYKTRWILETGTVDLQPLISIRDSLESVEAAVEQLDRGEACKIVFHLSDPPDEAADTPVGASSRADRDGETSASRQRPRWTHG